MLIQWSECIQRAFNTYRRIRTEFPNVAEQLDQKFPFKIWRSNSISSFGTHRIHSSTYPDARSVRYVSRRSKTWQPWQPKAHSTHTHTDEMCKAQRVAAIIIMYFVRVGLRDCKGIVFPENERCADAVAHIRLMNFQRFCVEWRCSTHFHRTKVLRLKYTVFHLECADWIPFNVRCFALCGRGTLNIVCFIWFISDDYNVEAIFRQIEIYYTTM